MKNRKLRFGAAFIVLIMCLGMFSGCLGSGITLKEVEKDPWAALMSANEKSISDLSEKYDDMFKVFDKIAEGTGTYYLDMSIPDTADMTVNAVVDSKTGAYSGKATVGSMGVSTEFSLWGDKNNIALSAPLLIGEGNYGVKFDTFETDLENSELLSALTGGMTFEDLKTTLNDELGITYDELKTMLSINNIKTAYNKYVTNVEAIVKELDAVVAEETVKVGETDVEAISVQYTLTKEFYGKVLDSAMTMVDSVAGTLLTVQGTSTEDIKAELDSMMDETLTTDIVTKDYLDKKTGKVVASDITYGDILKASIIHDDGISTIDATVTYEGETADVDVTVKEVTEEGKSGYVIDMNADVAGEKNTASISALRTDADGKYELKVTVDSEDLMTVAGTLTYSDTEFKLTVDSVYAEGVTSEIGLTFTAKAEGTVEAIPEYKNILTMTGEDLDGLMSIINSMILTPDYEDIYMEDDYYGDEYLDDEYLDDEYLDDEYFGDEYYDDSDEGVDIYEGMSDDEIAAAESLLNEFGINMEDYVA